MPATIGHILVAGVSPELGTTLSVIADMLAKPNGTLGEPVIRHLLRVGFTVTTVTRNVDKTLQTWPSISAIHGDYTSAKRLAQSLEAGPRPFDAAVSLLNRDQLDAQIRLLDAIAIAKIPHVIPSEFGFDLSTPEIRSWPWLSAKLAMEEHLLKLAAESCFTYTGIHVGAFFDWALERGILVNLLDNGQPTMVFDGGEILFDVTMVDTIGEAVAKALVKHMQQPEQVSNRFLHVHTAAVTQQQLLGYARAAAPDKTFSTVDIDTAEAYTLGLQKYRDGERGVEVNRLMQPRAFSGVGPGHFQMIDNEYLSLAEWKAQDVEKYIQAFMGKPR